jgi:golgin subfamily A member 4
VGEKAKFLTGADKIPDYLRNYFSVMKEKMAEFKINSIRALR